MRYGIIRNYQIKRSIMKEERRPLIGISCNYDYQDIFAGSGETAGIGLMYHYLSDNYVREVEKAGGIPVMIPIYRDEESLRECTLPSPGCRYHLSCLYRSRKAK